MRSEVLTARLIKIPVMCGVRPRPYGAIPLKTGMYLQLSVVYVWLKIIILLLKKLADKRFKVMFDKNVIILLHSSVTFLNVNKLRQHTNTIKIS
jgi:hypothetical protein